MSKAGCSMHIHSSKRGFSLIGMLAASAIGAILVAGIMQFFANINRSVKDMKAEINQSEMERYLLETIDCTNTLNEYAKTTTGGIWGGNSTSLSEIKNSSGNTVMDLSDSSETDRLEREYGIHNPNFEVTCVDSSCACGTPAPTPTNPCQKRWSLRLNSQKKVGNSYVYNYPIFFSVETTYKGNPVDPLPPSIFTCKLEGVGKNPCLVLTNASNDELTLAGCGGTENVRKEGTVAFGFGAGKSVTTGEKNTFVGYEAGKANTIGNNNMFLGYQAGSANIRGRSNIFIGEDSGKKNTRGGFNTFLGYRSGQNNNGSQNVYIGANAGGYDQTHVAGNNVFVGYNAGGHNTSGSDNTFIGFEAGQTNQTGSGNIYIGYRAGSIRVQGEPSSVQPSSRSNNIILVPGSNKWQINLPASGCTQALGGCSFNYYTVAQKNDLPGNRNVLIGSFSLEKQEELMSQHSNYLYIHDLIEGNKKEKWVSINHSLETDQLYASLNSLSDRRKKKNIRELKKSLEKINKLRPVQFEWKIDKGDEKSRRKKDKQSLGFIAQEVSSIIPEVVEKDRKGFFTINYPELIPLVVSAFKAFQKQVQNWINNLKKLIEDKADQKELNQVKVELVDTKKELKQTKKQVLEIKRELEEIKKQLKQEKN